MQPIDKAVLYFRISKPKKGMTKEESEEAAYGLISQRQIAERLLEPFNAKIVGEVTEIETGTRKRKRPKLAEAIGMARLHRAVLVIAKLDRMARNVAFTANLMESKVRFVACDNPNANDLTIHVLAACAEQEAKAIAQRTKEGLVIAKQKGKLIGAAGHKQPQIYRGFQEAAIASAEARTKRAKEAYDFLVPYMKDWYAAGSTYQQITDELNKLGHVTTTGGPFNAVLVCRIFKRLGIAARRPGKSA